MHYQPPPGSQTPQQPPQQQGMSNADRVKIVVNRLRYIKSECHQAVHPSLVRDRLREVIEAVEFLLTGQILNTQPNVVPGTPIGALEDPTKTRVEFFAGPGVSAQPPVLPSRAPVNSGDVHFIPGPPPGSPGAVGGQTVEYYGGPQHPGADPSAGGQRVEFFAGPGAAPPPAPPPVAPAPTVAQTPFEPPIPPPAPATNQPQQIVAPSPTLTTEAGHTVAPTPPTLSEEEAAQALEKARGILPIAEIVPVVPQGMPNGR